MTPDTVTRPAADAVGWCHNCETWQRGRDARWQEMWWQRGSWDWVCVRCDGEPWGLGVWRCSCLSCSADDETMGVEPCWKVAYSRCADALCVAYGPCLEHS
jgi:hypothetical protein